MTGEPGEAGPWAVAGGVSSVLSGAARDVVQARDVHGGVHFHASDATAPVPHQLPADVPGFVGRESELERLDATLEGRQIRAFVVAGTAGVGKTALAVRFAHRVSSRFPDGQLFVNLRGHDDGPPLTPSAALEGMLRALGAAPQAIPAQLEERVQLYRSLLAGRRTLVLLDNAATVGQVRSLLPGGPGCLVMVTSRNRLSGLAARDGAYRLGLGRLSGSQSVALLSAATSGHRPGDDPEQLAELARLCAYLPLALRIAAERAASRPWMDLRDLIADLHNESALWDTLSAEGGEEADAVRAVFAWSYRALPPAAAHAFRELGLHPGPHITVLAAAALLSESPARTRGLLDLLVEAHLLEQNSAEHYEFHDLMRAYASSQARAEESEHHRRTALARLATCYLHTADAAARATQSFFPSVLTEPPDPTLEVLAFEDYDSALRWHRAEQANLLALLRAAATAGFDRIVWQMSATLQPLHVADGPLDDWLEMGAIALEATRRLGDRRAEALIHTSLGFGNRAADRLPQAAAHHQAALTVRDELGDRAGAGESAHGLGLVHLQQRELTKARARFEQTLVFARDHDNHAWAAAALCCLAYTAAEEGDLDRAALQAEQALNLHREHGTDPYLQVDPLLLLSRVHREAGRYTAAGTHLAEADAIVARLDHRVLGHAVLLEQADLQYAQGSYTRALDHYCRYFARQSSSGDRLRQTIAFDGIGCTLRALGRLTEAIEFHQSAAEHSRRPSDPWRLAVALCHLAEALQEAGHSDRAKDVRVEADSVLAGFTDPRAAELRRDLRHPGLPAADEACS
jgi:tetratricopeptide (TPR) repeat protein